MLKDKAGNRLFRKMTVKIIFPDNIFPERTYVQHAGPRQGFGPEGVYAMLDDIATKLDELYPWWEFRPVELTPVGRTTRWVFTFAGKREVPASATPTDESNALEPGTVRSNTPENALADFGTPLTPSLFQEPVKIGDSQ